MKAGFPYSCLTAGLYLFAAICSASSAAENSGNPVGHWISLDFVQHIEDFQPGKKAGKGDLYLKDIEFKPSGKTSISNTWKEQWVFDQSGKFYARFYIHTIDGIDYLFLPWLSGDVTLRGQEPWFYVLTRAPSEMPAPEQAKTRTAFKKIVPIDSVAEYDDVRWKDLSRINSARIAKVLWTLDFNSDTIWPDPNEFPSLKQPDNILKNAMNPGLRIRDLHARGITGKGVNVAIIDQPLYPDHPEYAGKIINYFDTGCQSNSSMHGPGVTSLLVGAQCGTAPDAKVYYAAAPSWKKDAAFYATALDWIIEQNEQLPAREKIRVVSVSAAPSGKGSPFESNTRQWDQACARAEKAAILVLDCTSHRGMIGPCWLHPGFPEAVNRCTPGFPGRPWQGGPSDKILVPSSPRTTAEQYDKDRFGWQYNGRGGLSWAIPYAAGVLAMGWQVNPELTAEEMKNRLFETAYTTENGHKIINPNKFITHIKQ